MTKTPGQLAYEADLAICPFYHDGGARRKWEELPANIQDSWHKTPFPREWSERSIAEHMDAAAKRGNI